MTVTNTTVKQSYDGNGSNVTFAIPFDYENAGDIKVYLRDNSVTPATETLQTLTTNYTIVGANVVMVTAPTDNSSDVGEEVIVIRDGSETQTTAYAAGDGFPAETHENALDKLTRLVQENLEKISRSVKGSLGNAADLTLPEIVAGKIFGYNASGDGLALYSQFEAGVTDGDVTGPSSSNADTVPLFDGVTGKLIKDSGLKLVPELYHATAFAAFGSTNAYSPSFSTVAKNTTGAVVSITNSASLGFIITALKANILLTVNFYASIGSGGGYIGGTVNAVDKTQTLLSDTPADMLGLLNLAANDHGSTSITKDLVLNDTFILKTSSTTNTANSSWKVYVTAIEI